MAQAESGLLQLLQEYLSITVSDARWFYQVKQDKLLRILFYAQVKKEKEMKLRVEILEVSDNQKQCYFNLFKKFKTF